MMFPGNPINTTQPRKQFKLFATYDMNRLVQGLTVGAGVNWQSRIYTKHATYGEYGQKAYTLVNLMARYQFNDNFSAQLNIDNLFDKNIVTPSALANIATVSHSIHA